MSLFQVHKLNEDGMEKAKKIQMLFETFLRDLETTCPRETREFSLVRTKLEEASFFAKKSMAIDPKNQIKE